MESVIKKLGKTSITVEKDYHSSEKEYNKLTIVEEKGTFKTYLSRKPVPIGTELTNREYWIPFSGVLESITFDYLKFKKDYASGKAIEDNAIITRHILNRNIERIKIALKAVSEEEIDDNAIIERTIKDRNVTSNKIAQENILTEHFAKKSVITTILADYVITAIKLADNSVTTRSIVNENVTDIKLANNAVTTRSIAQGSIIEEKFDNNSVSTRSLIDESVTKEKLAKNSVTESKIADNNITNRKIANNTINITKFDSYTRNIIESIKYIPEEFTSIKEAIFDEINKYKPIVINGDVINAADEEDITSENNLLKLKDRSSINGMGYVILRKNKSFAEQVTKENTIYEIRYNFDLKRKTQSIPSNCVLKFVGGVISNGIISGNNTTIDGAEYGAFDSVRLYGSFTNIESNLSWWGCVPFDVNNQYDNSSKINDAFRSSITRVGVSRKYGVSKPIDISNSVVGISDIPGYKLCGFYANSNFSPITVTLRDNKSYEVNGLFYHYYDEHPSIENLTIDLRYCAKYAIEHIAGYSNIELSNVNIYNALVSGVLQYGCEKMTWNTLWVNGCRYGAVISNKKFDENNPFSFTTNMGQCNMVTLEHCRFVDGNYGLICNGGSNYKLDSCETSYNSLFGLILIDSSYLLSNYYSEGDCLANFWIDNSGIKSYPNSDGGITTIVNEWDKGRTHPYLIENNIDGILCKDGSILESNPYMRAIIYMNNSIVTLDTPFLSILPRSYNTSDILSTERELPTERNAHGIDALIISESGYNIILRNIKIFSLHNNTGTTTFTDIVMKAKDWGSYFTANNSNVSCDGKYQVRLWYDYFSNRYANFNDYRITYHTNSSRNSLRAFIDIKPSNIIYADLNSDQDSWTYGTSVITPYKHHSFKGYVKNVPVYKRDTSRNNYSLLNFTKEQSLSKFGDRMQIKCKFVAYIPEDVTSRVQLITSFRNSSYGTISSTITYASGKVLIKAGYYELTTIVPVRPKESEFNNWAKTIFQIEVSNESTIDIYVSDIYFFDIGDSTELCNNSNPVLVSGGTDLRPYLPFVGQSYFDTTIGKSIVWTGSKWIDATGADA